MADFDAKNITDEKLTLPPSITMKCVRLLCFALHWYFSCISCMRKKQVHLYITTLSCSRSSGTLGSLNTSVKVSGKFSRLLGNFWECLEIFYSVRSEFSDRPENFLRFRKHSRMTVNCKKFTAIFQSILKLSKVT